MSNEEEMEVSSESSSENEEEEEMQEEKASGSTKLNPDVYLPGKPVEQGEELTCDPSAYIMYHQAQTSAPCLSFDIISDSLGDARETYPLSAYIVAGTQAPQNQQNNLIVMKLSNLHKTSKKENEDDDDDDDELSDEEDNVNNPKMSGALIKHQGCVNRIRTAKINGTILAASWSELGRVNIFNLTPQLQAVESDQLLAQYNKDNKQHSTVPIFTFKGHKTEGFGLDWSPTVPGLLATGDCRKDIHLWNPNETSWNVDQRPLVGHEDSVEDLQWSPNERHVLASCSVDKSLRIWDTRITPNKACQITCERAHESDINVISWNRNEPFIVSGGDDGFLHIWDLRTIKQNTPLATFKHHTEPVTTVEWHPTDSAVFASGGADNQIALWDLSVEKDAEAESDDIEGIPPQLLFIHQGQTNIKELHWHEQLPGVIISTAESGFNIFRTISV